MSGHPHRMSQTGPPGSRRHEAYVLFAIDLTLVAIAFVGAVALRYGTSALVQLDGIIAICVPTMLVIAAPVFAGFGLYSRQWRHASLDDALAIMKACLVCVALFVIVSRIDGRLAFLPAELIVTSGILMVCFVGASRLALRVSTVRRAVRGLVGSGLAEQVTRPGDKKRLPILVVGAGDDASFYLRALDREEGAGYRAIGLLDDDEAPGRILRGVRVLGPLDAFEDVLEELAESAIQPRHVVFTEPLAQFGLEKAERLLNAAEARGIPASCLASPGQLRDPKAEDSTALRPIELTDLLDRPQAALDRSAVARLLEGRIIAVTGAGGSIGSELVRQIARYGPARLVLIENCEFNLYAIDRDLREMFASTPPALAIVPCLCDVRHVERVEAIFARHKPHLVFNAAALKHVPMVELNPCEGVLTNVVGTAHVAEAARRHGALAMVQVSTDKAVDPTSVMGATKRVGELYCQALDLEQPAEGEVVTRFMTTRFGNVLGSSGSLIPLFKRQLERGGPLTVTDERMTRFFMTIREAVELTLQASALGLADDLGRGEIFVLDMGEPLRIIDVARRMIRLAGLEPDRDIDIEIVGCRPGEKLFEELFDSEEQRVASPIPGVLGAIPQPVPLDRLRRAVADLEIRARTGDAPGIFAALTDLMPRYAPAPLPDTTVTSQPGLARSEPASSRQARTAPSVATPDPLPVGAE